MAFMSPVRPQIGAEWRALKLARPLDPSCGVRDHQVQTIAYGAMGMIDMTSLQQQPAFRSFFFVTSTPFGYRHKLWLQRPPVD
jgi:hypothetical protein